ncbi:hypothetical protein A7E78_07815 [Syntrophotalea acetylenivorans]|uniref:Uncharacterized protein n=1 Tax=Syntrophotalea acetylenivorans TaxID=1842532 RepID=A0A1L3GP93_9BACT|nr:hypothetical protein [Syntrophotalea acetylenivorans]APG27751.1 hypothetical protein A7E78_07815 [Syntrophotalea acetylenivorans]
MAGKIFYRERRKPGEGSHQARYMVVAVADVNLKIFGKHLRKCELDAIAEGIGAELKALPRGPKHEMDDEGDE